MSRVGVSACLLGVACRYDGRSKPAPAVAAWVRAAEAKGQTVVAVCPEELGELGTPRPGAHLVGGDGAAVLDGRARVLREADGGDVTEAFLAGAARAAALLEGASAAVLKARSPSCGCSQTTIEGAVAPGDGVLAALLRRRGLALVTDEGL